jgi:hypothetical protein
MEDVKSVICVFTYIDRTKKSDAILKAMKEAENSIFARYLNEISIFFGKAAAALSSTGGTKLKHRLNLFTFIKELNKKEYKDHKKFSSQWKKSFPWLEEFVEFHNNTRLECIHELNELHRDIFTRAIRKAPILIDFSEIGDASLKTFDRLIELICSNDEGKFEISLDKIETDFVYLSLLGNIFRFSWEYYKRKPTDIEYLTKREKNNLDKISANQATFTMNIVAELKGSICPMEKVLTLIGEQFIPKLNESLPLLNHYETDLGALWLEGIEEMDRKPKPKARGARVEFQNSAARLINHDNIFQEENEIYSFEIDINTIPKVAPRTLENCLLPNELHNMQKMVKFDGSQEGKIFSYELAFHLKYLETSLDLISALFTKGDLGLLKMSIPAFMNSYYTVLEQAVSSRCYELQHSLIQLFKELGLETAAVEDLDKLTFWYRYPHFSLAFNVRYQHKLPKGLALIISKEDLNAFAALVSSSLDILTSQINHHVSDKQSKQALLEWKEHFRSTVEQCAQVSFSDQSEMMTTKEADQSPSIASLVDLLPKIQSLFEGFGKQVDSRSFMPTLQDLMIHAERMLSALQLLEKFPEQKYLGLHTHQILMAGQYIVEHYFCLRSILTNAEFRTHHLNDYIELFNGEKQLSNETVQFILEYLNLNKGCDYPYWTFFKKQSHGNKGMDMINRSSLLAREEEGFTPKGMGRNGIARLKEDLLMVAEGVVRFIKEILQDSSFLTTSETASQRAPGSSS